MNKAGSQNTPKLVMVGTNRSAHYPKRKEEITGNVAIWNYVVIDNKIVLTNNVGDVLLTSLSYCTLTF